MIQLLEEYHLIHSYLGLIHTVLALLAMATGTIVILGRKGTAGHKLTGYAYAAAMLGLNGTALGIYNFGSFNLFHIFAIVSLLTLLGGLVPAWRRSQGWLGRHYYFMSWSIVGLYCAFWAEVGVRFFDMRYFWWVVMIATAGTAAVGAIVINRERQKLSLPEKDS